jgi:hypothetical protein
MTPAPTNSFLQRLIGAVSLDAAIYEEVEADRGATVQALIVVVLSSLCAGIGARGLGGSSPANIAFITIIALMAWAAWALVTLQVGGALLPEPQTKVDVGELLRTTGFATAPGILRLFGVLPGVTIPAFALCAVWMLAAMIVAVRQALDYTSTGRAIIVCVIGWALAIGLALVVGLLFGPTVA